MMKRILFVVLVLYMSSCQWLPEVGSVRLSESSVNLKVGGSRQLSATVEPAAAEYETILWTSSDPSVAIVTNGTISARKVGMTTISATAAGVTSNPCQVTVDATHVTGISLSNSSVEITEGESTTLKATVSPSDATDPSFIWGCDNTSVATVQNGNIVAISPGTANISVRTTDGNKTATCKVTVKSKVIDVTGITLSQSSISIKEEETLQLKATVKPSNATNQEVSWSSGDTGIATVASDGTVTGVIEGSTTITAKSADGKVTATCKVAVTAEYVDIPDPNFRKYIIENFDLNRNGKLSLTEAAAINRISVITDNIESLEGIEYMPTLTYLECSGTSYSTSGSTTGKLSYLDVSQNTALTTLLCDANKLATLDVSRNTSLRTLQCNANHLSVLDVSKNTLLTKLSCFYNLLAYLDVSKNTALTLLICGTNQLTSLDVSKNTALIRLECFNNHLTSLDVSKNTLLDYLGCDNNQLTSLDVSKNTALLSLSCNNIQLKSLDVSKNTALTSLDCGVNQLTTLDVSKNTALKTLRCGGNQLTTLDVSKNTALKTLWCSSNQLTTLDVSKNKSLSDLDCSPMSTLKTLYVSSGQSIEGVTVNRSTNRVPSGTSIKTK